MKTQIEDGGMNRKVAKEYASKMQALYPSFKVSVRNSWLTGGYEVLTSDKDGAYASVFSYVESCEDYLDIHGK